MTQEYLRELHRSGGLVELSLDSPMEQAPVLEPLPVVKTRAGRSPGGQGGRTKKKNQRARSSWRNEVWALTADQELVASVVDRSSYIRALQAVKRREERRADDEIEFKIRVCFDNGETAGWTGTGVTSDRMTVECFHDSMRRGNGGRPRTRRPDQLSEENRGESIEIYRLCDDETREMFSRILARDETSQSFTTCPVGAGSRVWETES
ncbi:MAG: hypothetical protein WB438_04475 [Candidatus Cybelea sp.]